MKLICFYSRGTAAALCAGLLGLTAPAARAASHTVAVQGDSFNPPNLTINAGDSVSWSGLAGFHNVTGANAGDLNQFCGSGGFGTETSCSHTFTTPGTFPYECTIHASCCGMVGSITVNAAQPPPTPSVSITNPVAGASFTEPANVQISADASVSSGTVTNVTFLVNGLAVGSATSAPFSATASSLAAGNYNLTAIATAAGISATSAVVGITVASEAQPPTVNITSPADGATLTAPATFQISADASVSSGAVTNVAFFANSTLVGSATGAPFTATASALAAGTYGLTAVATAGGLSTTSAVVTVNIVASAPVTLSAPAVSGGQFSFSYAASPGLSYVVESSPDLLTWTPVSTNSAATPSVTFNAAFQSSGALYYRVEQQPNP